MLYLAAEATRAALPMVAAIEAMEIAFGDDREVPLRSLLGGSLFMPGRAGGDSGVKVVSVVPGNPVGIVMFSEAVSPRCRINPPPGRSNLDIDSANSLYGL